MAEFQSLDTIPVSWEAIKVSEGYRVKDNSWVRRLPGYPGQASHFGNGIIRGERRWRYIKDGWRLGSRAGTQSCLVLLITINTLAGFLEFKMFFGGGRGTINQ